MLILTRKEHEEITVPDCGLTITVLDVQGKRVRLGVSAPRELGVYRGEVAPPIPGREKCREPVWPAAEEPAMSLRVLLADADECLLDDYRAYLEGRGCQVAAATTALECVARLREWPPDVLVLEPSLPWGGGDGVLAMMHEEPTVPLVPVIVLTRGRDWGPLYHLAPFKVDDYQVKPIRPKRLAERIRAAAHKQPFQAARPQPARLLPRQEPVAPYQ